MADKSTTEARAFWTWLLLTDLAARGRESAAYGQYPGRITYKELTDRVGGAPINIGPTVLELIASRCEQEGLPPLTGLVVSGDTGKPGGGFRHPRQIDDIYTFKWERIDNPFS